MFKQVKRRAGLGLLALVMSAGLNPAIADPGADDWIELPVVVNLYKGCSVTKAESEAYVKRANEVLKQAKIKLKIVHTNESFEVGNNDANQSGTEDAEAERKGKEELKNKAEGKGIKINFTDNPWTEKPGTNAWAKHKSPVIFLKENADAAKQTEKTGNTIAHEICHVLTIDYDLYTADSKGRLMHGTDGRTGTTLTDAEKEEIRKEAAKRGKIQEKPAGPPPSTPKQKETALGFNGNPASPNDHLGVKDAMVTAEQGDFEYAFRINTGGLVPAGVPDNYLFVLDIDADPATGVPCFGVPGAEFLIQVQPDPLADIVFVMGQDLLVPTNQIFTEGTLITEMKFQEVIDGMIGTPEPAFDAVDFKLPIGFFGPPISDTATVVALSADGFGPVDGLAMELDRLDGFRGPIVMTSDGEIDAAGGEAFTVSGGEFTPGALLDIELDDELIGGVPANGIGDFGTLLSLPPTTPTGTYFLTVSDPLTGDFGFAVIDVIGLPPCPADLTGSSDPNDPSYGVPDGDADGDDFFFYLDAFSSGNLGVCDLTGSSDPNDPSFGLPDGDCDGDDFFFYLELFAQGCP
ncbi:MAG: GC-type dockerin domain-anchored protein [Phycisphaerales bacterium JB037]